MIDKPIDDFSDADFTECSWPIETLQEGLEWITDLESGKDTNWPGDSVLYAIAELLRKEIERIKQP